MAMFPPELIQVSEKRRAKNGAVQAAFRWSGNSRGMVMQKQTQPKDRRFLKIVVGALIALLILIVIIALATDPR
ncbi:hypothetical protein [Sphingomonas aliaeris]|uniref:hypothetical protein n=1 Tax=Sphingomonas aliaeris TaxID=2759526 RepID=UPI001CEDC4C1|nr:hypothetical protein [Sphingomonas aliaeris]